MRRSKGGGSSSAVHDVLSVAVFRFRSTLRRRWTGYLGLLLLIGLIGGLAMASIAGARRTQSSYPRFLASTNPSDLTISYFDGLAPPELVAAISALPHVTRVESMQGLAGLPLAATGAPKLDMLPNIDAYASEDGLMSNQDRATIVAGRLADPTNRDEVVMTAAAAKVLGTNLGQTIPFGFYGTDEVDDPGFGTAKVLPLFRVDAKLVGIVVINNQVVQDDVDRLPATLLFTPALARQAKATSVGTIFGLQLEHGARDVAETEQAFVDALPAPVHYDFHVSSRIEAQVERTVKPMSVALGAFGAIAAIVTLLIAIQAIGRQLQASEDDRHVLRALGAGRSMLAGDSLLGVLIAVGIGSVLAAAVAIAMSPFAVLGPVRPVSQPSGIAFDWTVLTVGLLVLIVGLGAAAIALALRTNPERQRSSEPSLARGAGLARLSDHAGLPASGVVGVRFALDPGRGRTAAPVRAAVVGTALAITLVVATMTFGSGLHTLVSRPALYGWNWDYAFFPSAIIPPQALALLDEDPNVASWSSFQLATVEIDGQNVPTLVGDPNDPPTPPILSGHAVEADDQIVVGVTTLAQLHKHLGDVVVVSYGTPRQAPIYLPPTKLTIVGTATMPAVGWPSLNAEHPSMGTGATASRGVEPEALKQAFLNPDPTLNGPDLVFIRLKDNVSTATGRADMQRIADAATAALNNDPNGGHGDSISVLGVQRPAEIVNYRSMGSIPVLLAAGLAVGAAVALGLILVESVRRRRHDLALLKALGFTNRQIAAAIAWQSSVAAVIGIIVGVPIGIVLGRQLWSRFARSIAAVPEPTTPVLAVVLVAVGALVFANLVAALPGRSAARTQAAILLQSD